MFAFQFTNNINDLVLVLDLAISLCLKFNLLFILMYAVAQKLPINLLSKQFYNFYIVIIHSYIY